MISGRSSVEKHFRWTLTVSLFCKIAGMRLGMLPGRELLDLFDQRIGLEDFPMIKLH